MRKAHQGNGVFIGVRGVRCGGLRVLRRVAVSCLANLDLKRSSPTHTNFLFLGFPKAAMGSIRMEISNPMPAARNSCRDKPDIRAYCSIFEVPVEKMSRLFSEYRTVHVFEFYSVIIF